MRRTALGLVGALVLTTCVPGSDVSIGERTPITAPAAPQGDVFVDPSGDDHTSSCLSLPFHDPLLRSIGLGRTHGSDGSADGMNGAKNRLHLAWESLVAGRPDRKRTWPTHAGRPAHGEPAVWVGDTRLDRVTSTV